MVLDQVFAHSFKPEVYFNQLIQELIIQDTKAILKFNNHPDLVITSYFDKICIKLYNTWDGPHHHGCVACQVLNYCVFL